MAKKALLIIGNGFDIACGRKTKYSDFYKGYHQQLERAAKRGNELCANILAKDGNKQRWSDLESGLYQYSLELTKQYGVNNKDVADKFRQDFEELRTLLYNYLMDEDEKAHDAVQDRFVIQLYNQWNILRPNIYSFNYTANALVNSEQYQQIFAEKTQKGIQRFVFQHGSLSKALEIDGGLNEPRDLVLGIDESQHVEDLHQFLYKPMQSVSSLKLFSDTVSNTDVFIIFGCSMGQSDEWYFKHIFDRNMKGKIYLLYSHNQNGIEALKGKVRTLSGLLADFDANNYLHYISTENMSEAINDTHLIVTSL